MFSYVVGDVREPVGCGVKVIVHVCNDIGKMGAGVARALCKKWPTVKECYLNIGEYKRGTTQFVEVEEDVVVANMIAQKGIYSDRNGRPPIRYKALRRALKSVAAYASGLGASVHMPRIGSGLAGGLWSKVAEIIEEELDGVEVVVYDLPES